MNSVETWQKGRRNVDYVKGANIAGFLKVANSMLDMGVIMIEIIHPNAANGAGL